MSSASFFPRLNCLSIVFFPPLPCRSQHTDLHIIKKSVHKFHNASTRLTPIVVILTSWTLPEICPLGYVLCLPSVIPGSYIVFRITGFCMVNNKRQRLQDRSILPSFFPLAVRSLLFWSLEHVYSRPAALSALHRFRHLSVLSNARDQYFSESSLPNVQGVVCLSTPCSQPAVLHFYTRPFATVFTNSRLKTASPASIGLHPVLRIFGTHVKVVVNRLFFWCRHREIVVHVFLNVIDHVYAILKQCYLFHRLSMPCPTLLRIVMQKSFFLRHDFKALMQKLSKKDFFSPKNFLHTVAFNCFCSPSLPRRDSPCSASRRFRLGRWKPSRNKSTWVTTVPIIAWS